MRRLRVRVLQRVRGSLAHLPWLGDILTIHDRPEGAELGLLGEKGLKAAATFNGDERAAGTNKRLADGKDRIGRCPAEGQTEHRNVIRGIHDFRIDLESGAVVVRTGVWSMLNWTKRHVAVPMLT